MKRWVERGALVGGAMGGRWLIAVESVERLRRLRDALLELHREGNPSDEEIREMYRRPQRSAEQ